MHDGSPCTPTNAAHTHFMIAEKRSSGRDRKTRDEIVVKYQRGRKGWKEAPGAIKTHRYTYIYIGEEEGANPFKGSNRPRAAALYLPPPLPRSYAVLQCGTTKADCRWCTRNQKLYLHLSMQL
jgi:hypothetical protein